MSADHWSMIVFWNESSSKRPSPKPDVGLDYTDEPVPLPPCTDRVSGRLSRERRRRRHARTSDGIELQYGPGGFPPHYPGSGTLVPVPDEAEPAVAVVPDGGDDDDDHPPYPMEVHVEPTS